MADVSSILGNGTPDKKPDFLSQYATIQGILNAQENNKLLQAQTEQTKTSTTATQQQTEARLQGIGAGVAYALSNDPNLTPDLARSHMDVLAKVIPSLAPQIDVLKDHIKDMQTPELRNVLGRVAASGLDPEKQQRMNTPDISWQNNGQFNTPYSTYRPGNFIGQPAGMPTEAAPSVQQYPTPQWQPNYDPKSRTTTQSPSPAVGSPPGKAPMPAGGKPIDGTGGYPKPAQPAEQPDAQPAEKPGLNRSAPIGTTESIEANQKAYQAALSDIPAAQDRMRDLSKAHELLEIAHTGKGTVALQRVKEIAQSWGVSWDEAATNANAEAKKLLLNYALQRPGIATNQGMSEMIQANANTDQPNPVSRDITATNIAKERFQVLKTLAHKDPEGAGFLAHGKDFTTQYDRRAFGIDHMSPDSVKALVGGLKGQPTKDNPNGSGEYAKFMRSVALFNKYGDQLNSRLSGQ